MTPEAPAGGPAAGALPGVAGLSSAEAARRLTQFGANKLPEAGTVPGWRKLLGELTHFFAILLWCASVLAYLAGMPQLAIAIVVVILVNGMFAYIQQERAQHAASKLRELLPAMVSVRRDNRVIKVHTTELVPDDAVVLVAGDRVPADLRLAVAAGCSVDESMLTGESEALTKVPGDTVFGGTFLVNGQAEGVVAGTGGNTRLAEIAALTGKVEAPPSPLALELQRIVRITAAMALGIGVLFFVLSLLVGISWRDAFLFAIGVMVALVPEGLLPTVTLSLAVGAQRMAQRNALVRNLEAVETLGSTTFICTDKTGTLTQNRMNAVEVWTPAGVLSVIGAGYGPEAEITGHGSRGGAAPQHRRAGRLRGPCGAPRGAVDRRRGPDGGGHRRTGRPGSGGSRAAARGARGVAPLRLRSPPAAGVRDRRHHTVRQGRPGVRDSAVRDGDGDAAGRRPGRWSTRWPPTGYGCWRWPSGACPACPAPASGSRRLRAG